MYLSFQQHSGQRGFTLIEILITVALMSIALVALAKFQIILIQDINLTKSRTVAINLAQNKLETLRNYQDLSSFTSNTSGTETIGPSGSSAAKLITGLVNTYTLTWSKSATIQANDYLLDISVTWPDKNGDITTDTSMNLSTEISYSSPYQKGRLF